MLLLLVDYGGETTHGEYDLVTFIVDTRQCTHDLRRPMLYIFVFRGGIRGLVSQLISKQTYDAGN